jgi:hypothetical protein
MAAPFRMSLHTAEQIGEDVFLELLHEGLTFALFSIPTSPG